MRSLKILRKSASGTFLPKNAHSTAHSAADVSPTYYRRDADLSGLISHVPLPGRVSLLSTWRPSDMRCHRQSIDYECCLGLGNDDALFFVPNIRDSEVLLLPKHQRFLYSFPSAQRSCRCQCHPLSVRGDDRAISISYLIASSVS